MAGLSLRVVASTAIIAMTLFLIFLPELNKMFVRAEEDVLTRVLEHFTQPELFGLEELDLSGEWRYTVKSYEEGVLEGLYRPDAPTEEWRNVTVPFMYVATSRNSTIWLRKDFVVPEGVEGARVRLVFMGAFYRAEVWLNGVYLGAHEGYFAPFFFDVSDKLNYGGVNVLVVCLSTPVELDLDNKQGIVGVFNDWDMKPYPRWALGKLPPKYEWTVPIGLWRPVKLVVSGPVAVTTVLVDPTYDPSTGQAHLKLRFYVSNTGGEAACELRYVISPYNFEGRAVEGRLSFSLSGGERRWVETEATIPDAKLWWTWDQGIPHLYSLEYEVMAGGELQGRGSLRFGIREVEGVVGPREARIAINGRRVFLRGVNYISDFLLVRATPESLRRDMDMMLKANVNFVRVHAHVEPPEFYALADEAGVAVQADGPLIWAYASRLRGEAHTQFLRKAQEVFAEMILLLYNHPSVILWTVHNEPPWASRWMGRLYRMSVNRQLDEVLAALISSIDRQGRPIIMGSGYEDQHVYYGWFGGTWIDFLNDKSPFPTEFGAESLPSIGSPFWELVNVTHWPIKKGDREYYELTYRCFYWASGYVKIPYGLPEDYSSLEAYVKASQEYQAALLKVAISRYRILKFNVTAGLAVFMFKDCFPSVTFSVVDYFRVPKLAYRILAEELKPLKVLIEWGGDFEVNGLNILFRPNSTLRARIWVVNDAAGASGPALVRWRLVDLNESRVLAEGEANITIPSSDEPARLVDSLRLPTPIFTDGVHEVELEAALIRGGEELDSDALRFLVTPASRVSILLENASEPLTFLVRTDEYSFYVRSRGGNLSFVVPAGLRAVLYGPVLNASAPYVPVKYDFGRLEAGERLIKLRLVKGALYVLRTPMPSSDESRPPTVEFSITPLTPLEGPYVLRYTPSMADVLVALGFRGNTFVIPAATPVNVTYVIRGEKRSFTVSRGPITLAPGQLYEDFEPARKLAEEALAASRKMLKVVKARLTWITKRGFYAGLSSQWIAQAEGLIKRADNLVGEKPEEAVVQSREAYELLQNALRRLEELYSTAKANLSLLLLVLLLSSLGLASIVVEEEARRPAISTAALVVLGILVYLTYPGISEISTMDLFVSLYVSFFVMILVLLLPRLLEDLRSESGLPVFAAVAAALSIAARNLRRRSLRTGLALLSIVAMAVAVTNLSSVSYYVMSRELVTSYRAPAGVDNALMAFKDGDFNAEEILYVSSQPEVLDYGFKIDSVPRRDPYAYVALRAVRGFVSFYGYAPLLAQLAGAVTPPNALRELLSRGDAVLVSETWRRAGIRLGDSITIGGLKLRVVGFYDLSIGQLKDLGNHEFLPKVVRPDGTVSYAHPDDIVILSPEAALKLGGRIVRVYAKVSTTAELLELAKRLSSQVGYVVVARPAGGLVRVYYVGSAVEFRGGEALLPIALVFINVGMVVLASVYERRREIFTLASVGLNPTHIFMVFLSEAFLLGFVGGSLGYILSFGILKLMQVAGIVVPVDVKTSTLDLLAVVGLSTLSSAVAAVIPALRASAYATPSLRRRWRLEAELVGGEWRVEIPARIPASKAPHFADFVVERLREEEYGIERAVRDIRLSKRIEGERMVYEIEFTYSRGGNRPFTAWSRLIVRPVSPEFYGVMLATRPQSVYMRFSQSYVQEVTSFVRNIVLEWASLRVRLLAPVGADPSAVVSLVRHYHPQLVILVSRRGDRRVVREVRRRIRSLGLRPPAMELIDLRGRSINELVNEVRSLLVKADIVALDSDDGALSAAVALAAALEGRRVSILRDGRVEEVSVDKLFGAAAA